MALKSGRTGVRNDQVDFYGRVKSSGKEYEAGAGIVIEDDEISVDTETVAFKDDLEGKLDASKSAVSEVGGLVIPSVAPVSDALVGVDTTNGQEMIGIGDGLEIEGGVLKATGGSNTGYTVSVTIPAPNEISIYSKIITPSSSGSGSAGCYVSMVNITDATVNINQWAQKSSSPYYTTSYIATTTKKVGNYRITYCDSSSKLGLHRYVTSSSGSRIDFAEGVVKYYTFNPITDVLTPRTSSSGWIPGGGSEAYLCENYDNERLVFGITLA